mmetsp:Transcript_12794/g.31861  ORF Transcript_12794/g.31861 Transcript_12794/m.31861 type:complete len:581 (-) Transcript_12794:31-1773(-)
MTTYGNVETSFFRIDKDKQGAVGMEAFCTGLEELRYFGDPSWNPPFDGGKRLFVTMTRRSRGQPLTRAVFSELRDIPTFFRDMIETDEPAYVAPEALRPIIKKMGFKAGWFLFLVCMGFFTAAVVFSVLGAAAWDYHAAVQIGGCQLQGFGQTSSCVGSDGSGEDRHPCRFLVEVETETGRYYASDFEVEFAVDYEQSIPGGVQVLTPVHDVFECCPYESMDCCSFVERAQQSFCDAWTEGCTPKTPWPCSFTTFSNASFVGDLQVGVEDPFLTFVLTALGCGLVSLSIVLWYFGIAEFVWKVVRRWYRRRRGKKDFVYDRRKRSALFRQVKKEAPKEESDDNSAAGEEPSEPTSPPTPAPPGPLVLAPRPPDEPSALLPLVTPREAAGERPLPNALQPPRYRRMEGGPPVKINRGQADFDLEAPPPPPEPPTRNPDDLLDRTARPEPHIQGLEGTTLRQAPRSPARARKKQRKGENRRHAFGACAYRENDHRALTKKYQPYEPDIKHLTIPLPPSRDAPVKSRWHELAGKPDKTWVPIQTQSGMPARGYKSWSGPHAAKPPAPSSAAPPAPVGVPVALH